MGDNNKEIRLTDVIMAQPTFANQNKLIMQLMEQIVEMRVEMQRRQDLSTPIFAFNSPIDERPQIHFPSSNMDRLKIHPPILLKIPHYAFAFYQKPPYPQCTKSKCHLLLKIPLKTKTLTIRTPPYITKISIPIPRLPVETTKPPKMPRVLPLFQSYHKNPISKS